MIPGVCVCVLHWEWMTILFFDVLFHCQTIHVYIIVSSTLGQRVPTSWWMPEAIYFLRGLFFCSKEVEDMCQRYSWIELQFDAPSVLLPNAWFSLEPRLLLRRRWKKDQAVSGFPRADMLKTWNCHPTVEAICLARNLHFPTNHPFSGGKKLAKTVRFRGRKAGTGADSGGDLKKLLKKAPFKTGNKNISPWKKGMVGIMLENDFWSFRNFPLPFQNTRGYEPLKLLKLSVNKKSVCSWLWAGCGYQKVAKIQ